MAPVVHRNPRESFRILDTVVSFGPKKAEARGAQVTPRAWILLHYEPPVIGDDKSTNMQRRSRT